MHKNKQSQEVNRTAPKFELKPREFHGTHKIRISSQENPI